MADQDQVISIFPLRIDAAAGRLWKGEEAIELRPKAWEMIQFMASRPGELISKQELMDAVWPDTFVSESSLNQSIRELRKALGDNARSPRFIETVHRRGFRLLTARERGEADESAPKLRPLFGREQELEVLRHSLKRAEADSCQMLFVTGEAGIGKTSVVRHFLKSGLPGEHLVGWGHCYDLHGESEAFVSILECIDRLARGVHGEQVQEKLAQFAPSWLSQFPWMANVGGGATYDIASTPARMLREFCDFIEACAGHAPVVLWLEDLHWSDAATIDLLDTLARRQQNTRLLVICSYRPVDAAVSDAPVAHLKRALEASELAQELSLEFLEPQDVERVLQHRLGSDQLPELLADVLYEQTSGNPLFVSAMLEHLLSSKLLHKQGEKWKLDAPVEEVRQSSPESLRRIIELQKASISADEAMVLDAASSVGIEFDTQAVAGALDREPLGVEAVLDHMAERGQFLNAAGTASWPDGSTCNRYRFIHDVFRDSVYQSVLPGQKQHYHRRIAECMDQAFEGVDDSVAAEVAMHSELGGDRQRAVRYLVLAARKTQLLKAPHEVTAYLERALIQLASTVAGAGRDARELEILLQLLPAIISDEGFTSTRLQVRIDQALTLCDRLGDANSCLRVLVFRANVLSVPGDWKMMEGCVRQIIEASEQVTDPKLRVHRYTLSAWLSLAQGKADRARKLTKEAIDLLDEEESKVPARLFGHDPTVGAFSYLGFSQWLLGRADEARAVARLARARALEVGAPQSLATAFHLSMTTALFRGEFEEAQVFEKELQEILERHALDYVYMRPLAARVTLLSQQGHHQEAIQTAREGISLARRNRALAWSSVSLAALAQAHLGCGEIENGLVVINEALAFARRVGERTWIPEVLRIKGHLLAASGDTVDAEQCFQQALDEAEEMGLLSLELRAANDLAELKIGSGREPEARQLLQNVAAQFTEGFETPDYQRAQSLLSSGRVRAAR